MLKIKNLTKSFDGRKIFDDFSIDLPHKGFIAICGPSGCGKTTLLRIIAGIERSDSGSIEFPISKPTASMSFQEARLLPRLTARENVNLVLGDKKATLPIAEELLNKVGIIDTSLYPEELSGGMKARVSIARALAIKADVYLFDEPFASLDSATADLCAEVIHKMTADALTVAVIHDVEFAKRIADRIIYLK